MYREILLTIENSTAVVIGIICLAAGIGASLLLSRVIGIRTITTARKEAKNIVDDGRVESDTHRKQIELDARNEMSKRREQFDLVTNETRDEFKKVEQRIAKREDTLDRQLHTLTTKEESLEETDKKLQKREQTAVIKEDQIDGLIKKQEQVLAQTLTDQKKTLLRISSLSTEDARKEALKLVEQEVEHETAQVIQRGQEHAEEKVREHAQRITLQAIQRFASEHTADSTVSAVPIPSDDIKGRVIGREGRNIRAFEKATGVDVIVDDTPGVVVISCFDPVRRAIAVESLQKLIDDGRIHPARIEEVVEQMQKEINERIVRIGKDGAIEANVQGLHGRISDAMGRLYYRTSYGQNILRHSMETAYLCQVIASELDLDGTIARRCGYLHDIGKAMDHDVEGGHPQIGMNFCKKLGEDEIVLNAIGGHHNDIPAISPYTPIVMAADAISGARPGARRETLDKYVRRLEQLEGIATGIRGVKQAYAIQAGREVRVVVDPDTVDDTYCQCIARNIAKVVSEEMTFPGEIRITVLREIRTVEYAR